MIIDIVENISLFNNLSINISKAFKYILQTDFSTLKKGKHEIDGDSIFVLVNEYETKQQSELLLEAHKKYIDIQIMLSGVEQVGYVPLKHQSPEKEYDPESDYMLFREDASFFRFEKGMFAIFFPADLHMPGVLTDTSSLVRKAVVKVKI